VFFDTNGYFGTQYDVKANVGSNGSVQILSKSETALKGDAQNPGYVPDSYQLYESIEQNLDRQLQDALKKPVGPSDGDLSGRLVNPLTAPV
jgi:hypothetical protein